MKTALSFITVLLVTGSLSAQKIKLADVPEAVRTSFTNLNPNVKDADWEKEGADYEVSFDVKRVGIDNPKKKETIERSMVFNVSGKLLQTEDEIKTDALPKAVKDYVAAKYPEYKLSEAAKITDDKGLITYEAEVEKGREEFDLIFDANGNFLSKEAKDEDKD